MLIEAIIYVIVCDFYYLFNNFESRYYIEYKYYNGWI